ncbi:carbohydrate ABC transporter permease [Halalkalibacter flavus]|uniref:carbohydrate ABC transporter permease n=1 Tax=Halalkalibacter flavus TaxID=3090668 RepID=UPI002FC98926
MNNTSLSKQPLPKIVKPINKKNISYKSLKMLFVYAFALLYSFPIIYMILTAFKSEYEVSPPSLIFKPTLETFREIFLNASIWSALSNSVIIVSASAGLALLLGVPAAYALVFAKFKKATTSNSLYLWFITTIILPPVAVIIPITSAFKAVGLLGSHSGLILVYTGFHIPLVIWMVYSYFAELPKELIEAAELDGASKISVFIKIMLPLCKTGIISAGLLVTIFIWNEFFIALNLAGNSAITLPVYMSRFGSQMGLFYAKLAASSTLVIVPVLVLGFLSQKSLVKGLSMGAVKG